MPESPTKRAESQVTPPTDFVLVSTTAPTMGADITLPAGTRGLLVGTGGLLSVTLKSARRDGVPFPVGLMPGSFVTVHTDAGNTAANIWAVL